jgi:hypothetical protein
MRQTYEKCTEFNIDLHNLFIDFRSQAFDEINRSKMLQALKEAGIPNKLIKLIHMTLNGSKAVVALESELTNEFEINVGVRQGDILSAVLFNLTLEMIIRKLDVRGKKYQVKANVCICR